MSTWLITWQKSDGTLGNSMTIETPFSWLINARDDWDPGIILLNAVPSPFDTRQGFELDAEDLVTIIGSEDNHE